ncbi:hypothetical protein GE061_019520 [Apolygus lucorum]|uniref:Radial spoke head protein 3 homolog n=1 Tax=Apolygus lucorum TaxID=248454 RepID=A0A8S9X9U6_APOLU|nr:hypothetical protein GE061_019520 [Apolygus lucorum]
MSSAEVIEGSEVNVLEVHPGDSPDSLSDSDAAFTVINDAALSDRSSPLDDYVKTNDLKNNNLNNGYQKTFSKKNINLSGSNMTEDFVNSLDAKLRDLEDGQRKRNKKNKGPMDNRPMFITTVKTGIFLDPPPELAALLGYPRSCNASSGSTTSQKSGEGLMYSYSSQPRVVNTTKYASKLPKPTPKISNEKQQQNNEKFQARTYTRAKRDIGYTSNINKKTEDPPSNQVPYGNIMYDRRVIRGPAFMHHPVPTSAIESQAARQAEARRRAMARRKAQTTRARNLRLRMGTPPPVEGRKHEDIQTEEYLEDLFEHPPVETVFTQTDYYTDRPPTPEFVPAKTGVDISTQIYPGELFHFDTEVKPILEVLVGKTIEQALVEVMEEDELAAIREQQRRFREIRDAELAEQGRLEEEEKRKRKEMEMRLLEQEDAVRDQRSTEDRIAAAVLTTGYIADLLPSVIKDLNTAGFLYDETKQEVDEKFMPWLMKEVKTEMQKMVENRELISDILREIIETRAEVYRTMGEKEEKWRGTSEEPEEELPEFEEVEGEIEGELEEEVGGAGEGCYVVVQDLTPNDQSAKS